MNIFNEYQTLIAALLQVLVAIVALWPVYRQMSLARIQSAMASREFLIARVEAWSRQRQKTKSLLHGITDEFARVVFQYDPDEVEVPKVDAGWAHGAEQEVENAIRALSDMIESKADPLAVDETRERVIASAKALESCLCDLHQWASVDFEDPEYGLADPGAERQKAMAASEEASKVIGARIGEVGKRGRELDAAYESAIAAQRSRIRQIDELVLSRERS
jgi:hypothetical protein